MIKIVKHEVQNRSENIDQSVGYSMLDMFRSLHLCTYFSGYVKRSVRKTTNSPGHEPKEKFLFMFYSFISLLSFVVLIP